MAHIPRAVCVPCKMEMRISRNSVELEMLLPTGKPYYQIEADEYACPKCGHTALVGFAQEPYIHHFDPEYQKYEPDMSAEFAL